MSDTIQFCPRWGQICFLPCDKCGNDGGIWDNMTDDEKKKMIDDITNGVYKHMQNALGIKDSDHE